MERFKMELESLSKNEEFARVVAAGFMSRMDPRGSGGCEDCGV